MHNSIVFYELNIIYYKILFLFILSDLNNNIITHLFFPLNRIDNIFRIEPKLSINLIGFSINLKLNCLDNHFLMNLKQSFDNFI